MNPTNELKVKLRDQLLLNKMMRFWNVTVML